MAIFYYKAIDKKTESQTVITGKIKALDAKMARFELMDMGLMPVSIQEDLPQGETKALRFKNKREKIRPMNLQDKISFTSTFKILAQSGVPVIESLIFMENDADSAKVRAASRIIKEQILEGSTYSQAISRYPYVFGTVYIGLSKAGEDSGEMEKTLGRICELLTKEAKIRDRVSGALIYPVFVILLSIVALLIMLMVVFPTFKEMFDNLGKELPIYTRICIDMGIFLKQYWVVIPLTFFSLGFGAFHAYRNPRTRKWIDVFFAKIPVVSNLLFFANLSNFFAVLQVAYEAGIPIVDCLYLANLTLDNYLLRAALSQSTREVQRGQQLSVALKNSGVIPRMMLFLIGIGEQSGRLGEMLEQGIAYIDHKLDKVIDTMTKLIEPVMLIVIGGMVLFLALALYLPLFQAYEM